MGEVLTEDLAAEVAQMAWKPAKPLDNTDLTHMWRKKMVKVESILQGDAVISQPLWRSVFTATSKNVKGYKTHPTLYHQFQDVWLA